MISKSNIVFSIQVLVALFVLSVSEIRHHPQVHCETTKGPIKIEVYPEWSPIGAERFLALVADEFYTNIALYRSVKRFLVQFGISDNPIKKHWHGDNIPDDPNLHMGIKKNYVSYAGGGPNTRSTQLFIAYEDLDFLGNEPWETPFGKVIEGQETLDQLFKGYGDIPPFGNGPDQQMIYTQGNAYIRSKFPRVDFINFCTLLDSGPIEAVEEKPSHVQDGFVPEDDDSKKKNSTLQENQEVSEKQSEPQEHANSILQEGGQAEEDVKDGLHGNLRERDELDIIMDSSRLLEDKITPSMFSKKDIIALRALSLLIFVAVAMFFYGKYYYSTSHAALFSKKL